MKDAYYFSHDSNAKDDPKCMMLIETLQLEGYGIFWMLVETLRDQPGYKYPLMLIPALARRYNTTPEKIKTVVMNFGLFEIEDKEFFYSDSLNRRMSAWDMSKEKFKIAGIASGKARRIKAIEHRSNNVATSLELIDKNRIDKNRIDKKPKVRDIKHKYGEYKHVLLTDKEYKTLPSKVDSRERWIKQLDEYLENHPKKTYANHSLTIQNWYRKDEDKKPVAISRYKSDEVLPESKLEEGNQLLENEGGLDAMFRGKLKTIRNEK